MLEEKDKVVLKANQEILNMEDGIEVEMHCVIDHLSHVNLLFVEEEVEKQIID
jgi:hypothetical protein